MNPPGRVLITGGSGFIGTNLVAAYLAEGAVVCNFDCAAPRNPEQRGTWRAGDVLDAASLGAAVVEFAPDVVFHLAARTDLGGRTPAEYRVNAEGVANLLQAVSRPPRPGRVIVASSMLVCRLGYEPANDTDYCPDTAYGESKRQTELLVRAADCPWVLLRPTSIWGPWFGSPYREFFESVRRGFYVHPRGMATWRTYGFIDNVVHQLRVLAGAPDEGVLGRVFYLGDPALEIGAWADQIAAAWGRGPVPHLPLNAFRVGARLGDVLLRLGVRGAPLTSRRLHNLATSMVACLDPIEALAGPPGCPLPEGTRSTVAWMQAQKMQAQRRPAASR